MAGRELDALVAGQVMGWRLVTKAGGRLYWHGPDGLWLCGEYDLPHYSTDTAAAMQIIEKLRPMGFAVTIMDTDARVKGNWSVCFDTPAAGFEDEAPTLPEAICRAAPRSR